MQLRLFVYGTLKQTQRNFSRYCRGVISIESACVLGRLYHLPYGYPMLEVPPEQVLAIGSRDYLADAKLLERLAPHMPSPQSPTDDWQSIVGEIQTFDDPLTRLPPLDELENFRPGEQSLYHRVALRVLPPLSTLVWTYVAADGRLPAGAVRIGPQWNA